MDTSNSRVNGEARGRKTWRLLLVALVALLLGAGAGVWTNFILAEPKTEKAAANVGENGKSGETLDSEKAAGTSSGRLGGPSEFDISRAMADIYALSEQIGERPGGSGKEAAAAGYVVQKLTEAGYTVEEQPFTTPDGFGTRNMIATRGGKRDGYAFIVGAHMDSPTGGKGACDDASGVGVVLELARDFSSARIAPTLKFVFFGSNRPGASSADDRFTGGRRFVAMLGTMDKKDITGMVAVDQVACGDYLALRTQETGTQRLRDKMAAGAREEGLPVVTLKSTTDSENILFEDAHMPSVWLQWCDAGGGVSGDDAYAGVLAGKVEAAGSFIRKFLVGLTHGDLRELKY